ncbi:MAG: biotin--[acetyl-CoA-carboxylase] ligase [Rickettsiales bacterium]|nr:biotin--[acetyl-CoA-carboxylase] ligase [Rickettsiales bacterium]
MIITKNFQGFTIKEYEILDSTNEEAKRILQSQKNISLHKNIIIANSQTAGKGRYEREWISEEGNLFASFIFDVSKENSPQNFSYFFALAIAKLLENLGLLPVIKWPNDVLIDDKKICGILLEKQGDFLICGVGLNIKSSPQYLIDRKTTCLADLGFERDKNFCLNEIIKNLDAILLEEKNFGFAKIAEKINSYLKKNFAEINLYNKKIAGEIIMVDNEGLLEFKVGDELKKLSSGEVFFL